MIRPVFKLNVGRLAVIVVLISCCGFYVTVNGDSDLSALVRLGLEADSTLPAEITTNTGMELVLIPAGEFTVRHYASLYGRITDDDIRKLENFFLDIAQGVQIGMNDNWSEEKIKEISRIFPNEMASDDDIRKVENFFLDIVRGLQTGEYNEQYGPPREIMKEIEHIISGANKPRFVTITKPFYLGKYPVTQRQWEEVMGNNPSIFAGNLERPVENVSWDDVQVFIDRINAREKTGRYRLPTEAEWEYAARAGTTTKYFWGDDGSERGKYAWYRVNASGETHPVGTKLPNPWNLYDILGNVMEWVQDRYDSNYLSLASEFVDPNGSEGGTLRVIRSSGWDSSPTELEMHERTGMLPYIAMPKELSTGFRLAASVD